MGVCFQAQHARTHTHTNKQTHTHKCKCTCTCSATLPLPACDRRCVPQRRAARAALSSGAWTTAAGATCSRNRLAWTPCSSAARGCTIRTLMTLTPRSSSLSTTAHCCPTPREWGRHLRPLMSVWRPNMRAVGRRRQARIACMVAGVQPARCARRVERGRGRLGGEGTWSGSDTHVADMRFRTHTAQEKRCPPGLITVPRRAALPPSSSFLSLASRRTQPARPVQPAKGISWAGVGGLGGVGCGSAACVHAGMRS